MVIALILPSRLREGLGVGLQSLRYKDEHAFDVSCHVCISNPENAIAVRGEIGIPLVILILPRIVGRTVQFNHEPLLTAQEIREKWAYRKLAAELVAI